MPLESAFKFCPECGVKSEAATSGMKLVIRPAGGETRELPLDGSTATLGTGPDATVRLQDCYASKRHCQFTCTPEGDYQVEDLGSLNGTFAKLTTPVVLAPGSQVLAGSTLISIEKV